MVATGSAVPGVGLIHMEAATGLTEFTNLTTTKTVVPQGYSVGFHVVAEAPPLLLTKPRTKVFGVAPALIKTRAPKEVTEIPAVAPNPIK